MPSLHLVVGTAAYGWPLPEGKEQITVAELKQEIKESYDLLYHDRLRFKVEGQILDDNAALPSGEVKVAGPESVICMLKLKLQHDPSKRASRPAEKQEPPPVSLRGQPQVQDEGLPGAGLRRHLRADTDADGVKLKPGQSVRVLSLQARPDLNGAIGRLRTFNASSSRWEVDLPADLGGTKLFKSCNLSVVEVQARRPFNTSSSQRESAPLSLADFSFSGQQASAQMLGGQQAFDSAFDEALEASITMAQADEEAQLRWALEESARLAEAEARSRQQREAAEAANGIEMQTAEQIREFYDASLEAARKKAADVPSESRSTDTPASVEGCRQVPWDIEEEEGFAWDSKSETPAESDDDGPPPLELIPDTEE